MSMNAMTFLVNITCEQLWEFKHDYEYHGGIKINKFLRHSKVLNVIYKLCNVNDLGVVSWSVDVTYL